MKSRWLFLFVNTFILVMSLLTALRVLPGPDMVGMALAFYVLFFLPGLMITRLVSAGEMDLLEEISRIFIGGLIFQTIILSLGLVPGVSFRGIAVAGTVVNIVMLFLIGGRKLGIDRSGGLRSDTVRDRGEKRIHRIRIAVALLLFVLCFVFFYGSGETRWDSDALDHMSYVRRGLASGALFPNDSFHRNGDGAGFDPRKGIWHPIMALWAYQGDVPTEFLWRMLPSFVAFFALAFFMLFAMTVTGRPLIMPAVLLLLLLFYRGEGIAWLAKVGFSRNLAHMVLWGGAAFLIRYSETGRRDLLVWIFGSVFVGAALHIVFALNMAVTCIAFLIYMAFFRNGRSWLGRGVTAMVVAAVAAVLPLAVRAAFTSRSFNLIHTHRQAMLILSDRFALVDPVELLARLGTAFFFALILIPFFLWFADGGERRKLTWVLFLFPVLLVLNPITGRLFEGLIGYLHYRMLYAAPMLCYLGTGLVGLFRVMISGRREGMGKDSATPRPGRISRRQGGVIGGLALRVGSRIIAAGLIALFLLFPLRFSLQSVRSSVKGILGEGTHDAGTGKIISERILSGIPDNSVIVSDPRTSYIISAFTDHYVTVTLDQHCSPTDTIVMDRLRETRNLFNPAVPFVESAGWLLDEGADYLLVDTGYKRATDFFATIRAGGIGRAYEKFIRCEEFLEEILSLEGFHLFRIDREALLTVAGSACSESTDRAIACPAVGEGETSLLISSDMMILERIVTERTVIAPGDTLHGYFCWSSDHGLEFGLPLEWTIRLDGEFPKGAFYRRWYGKQYRRSIERDTGGFYRFTYSGRLSSGSEQPDQWEPYKRVRQDFAIPVTEWLHEGGYVMRVSVRRLSYLPNRTIGDYFLNEDSFHGVPFGSLLVRRERIHSGD